MTFLNFLSMGGFAFYVWTAYGIVFFTLLFIFYQTKRRKKYFLTEKSLDLSQIFMSSDRGTSACDKENSFISSDRSTSASACDRENSHASPA